MALEEAAGSYGVSTGGSVTLTVTLTLHDHDPANNTGSYVTDTTDYSKVCMREGNNAPMCYDIVDADQHFLMTRHTVVVLWSFWWPLSQSSSPW